MTSNLERDGFAIVPAVLNEALRVELLSDLEASLPKSAVGVRILTSKIGSMLEFAGVALPTPLAWAVPS